MDEEKNIDNLDNIENTEMPTDSPQDSAASSADIRQEIQADKLPEEENEEEGEGENNGLVTVRPVKFQEFDDETINRSIKKNLDIMQDISMHVTVEIGRTKSTVREIMDLEKGSVVELDKIAGEQVEVYANNKLVARGEVIVIEDKFGVRVTTTSIPKQEEEA